VTDGQKDIAACRRRLRRALCTGHGDESVDSWGTAKEDIPALALPRRQHQGGRRSCVLRPSPAPPTR
jgi:hypothetical protein